MWYKERSGNSCFSQCKEHRHSHREIVCKNMQTNQRKPFSAGSHCLLTPWFSWVGTMGQPAQTSPARACLSLKSPQVSPPWCCSSENLWLEANGFEGEKKQVQRGPCPQKACWTMPFFLGRSHIYMTNLHVAETVTEYFQESRIINVLAVSDCFFSQLQMLLHLPQNH